MNKTIILLLLLIIPLASAELIGDGTYNIITTTPTPAKQMTDGTYNIYAEIPDLAGNLTDGTYNIYVGLIYQLFIPVEEEAEEEEPTGGGGGGGRPDEPITVAEFNTTIKACAEMGGVPVKVKGDLYCKTEEGYIPLSMLKGETSIFGIKIPNLGAMVSSNTIVGWAAIFVVIIGSLVFIVRIRQSKSDKEVRRELIKQKRAEEEGRNQKT